MARRTCVYIPLLIAWTLLFGCSRDRVDFNTQVKPIINKKCISCHGGVKRNGGFSLLFRHEALDTTESGKYAIVPGDPSHSEMIRRLTLSDPEERMPYKEEPLTNEEVDILTKWVEQGAEWGNHWAYVPPKAVDVPRSTDVLAGMGDNEEAWAKNDIDYFILDKLKAQNLKPSPEADKRVLLRRAYMDITGVPPTQEQAAAFLKDTRPDAYEKMVDQLLASPQYGEKWASWWLDLARYSDTKGYERDGGRVIWRYRDWVINAFNKDMPFDQFTREQLAGDLLPNPTDDQLIATGFHRNTMNNDEGGTEDEEFRVAALIDRVGTTWEVWQSTTLACVQCHSHPYDPFVHDEYYKSMAFFNNTRDEDTDGEYPTLRIFKEEDQRKLETIKTWVRNNGNTEREKEAERFLKVLEPKIHPHDFDQFINGELIDTKWLGVRNGGSARLKSVNLDKKTHLIIDYWTGEPGGSMEIRLDNLKGEQIANVSIQTTKGEKSIVVPLKPTSGTHDLYFILHNPRINKDYAVAAIEWFAFREDLPGKGSKEYPQITKAFMEIVNAETENTPVMIENTAFQHRDTRVFERGNWMVKGQSVKPAVPHSLNKFPENASPDRLGFVDWMMSKENPLTSRTIVNRFWEQLFGYGIVESLEDFGTQGAPPSHPELLDWLALRMNDYQWSMKKLVKEIVMSATYRQDSRVTPELLEKDQRNMWLARGPRVRLSAEQVHDQALAVSGLLSNKMFGKSVMPYQPDGIWSSVWSNEYWVQSKGEDQYRRSVYTYVKRTSPYPSMMMFDGSSREVCLGRRIRTNTPLQALVTLNDPVYLEAARSFAQQMVRGGKTPEEQIRAGYERIVFHPMSDKKLNVMKQLYADALMVYSKKDGESKKLLQQDKDNPSLAAMTVVANAMLNLDEVITKE